jgi:hypothetical protein
MQEQDELDAYRVVNDLTFQQLADQIGARTSTTIARRTLEHFLTRLPADGKAARTTMFKIRKFLATVPAGKRRRMVEEVRKVVGPRSTAAA